MARKVFISFLGSSDYGECKYSSDNFISENSTKFVQQATLEWIKHKEGTYPEQLLILLTRGNKGSRINNWKKDIIERYNYKSESIEKIGAPYKGLEGILGDMGLQCRINDLDIPDGKDDKEIWEIFDVIFNQLQDEDQLYFDLTHGFRYLPMLLLVLGNYAKFLKNVKIAHISYGNYEARENNIAPFVDLLPLSNLQDWSDAADDFISFGKVSDLHPLLEKQYIPLIKEARSNNGKNEEAEILRSIDKKLIGLIEYISSNNMDEIIKGVNLQEEIRFINEIESPISKPFIPLLEKIETKISNFRQNNLYNVFAVTNWCINHELYQNAYSILLEGTISIVLDKIGESFVGKTQFIEDKRGLITYVAECKLRNKSKEVCVKNFNKDDDSLKEILYRVWDFMDENESLSLIIVRLNARRNAYMHAGTGTNSLGSFESLKNGIKSYCQELSNWYNNVPTGNFQFSISNSQLFINLSNHPSPNWSSQQLAAAQVYGKIIDLPFPDINPSGDEEYIQSLVSEYIDMINNYQLSTVNCQLSVHIMGEMTFTFAMVNALQNRNITCVASTTERISSEESGVKTSEFRFVQFRKYQ